MPEVSPARSNIFVEEVRYRSSVSEAVGTKLAGSINFINTFQYSVHSFSLNGPYSLLPTATGPDGVFPCLFNLELVGYIMYSGDGGSAGTTTIDLHRLTGGSTDAGSILTTKPSVDSTAASESYQFVDIANNTTLSSPTGHTLADFNLLEFNAGDAIRLDLDSAMTGGENLNFQLMFRPRN